MDNIITDKKHKTSGFTIVELLIVIVVIAILAAITVVAFSGIQDRSKNSQMVSTAQQWKKLISLYIAQNGAGVIRNSGHYCLGSGFPTDWDVNPDEDCLKTGSTKHPSAAINTALATVGTLPKVSPPIDGGSSSMRVGVSLRQVDTLDPTGSNYLDYPTLWYYLSGQSQDCVLRPVVTVVTGGITIDPTAKFTGNDGTTTICRIALPDLAAV